MELPQVTPGQGWLSNINNNFSVVSQEFSKKASRADIVYLDGWQKDTNPNVLPEILKTPMADGKFGYTLKISAGKEVAPNERGHLLIMPEGYLLGGNYLGDIPVQYDGHIGGYVELIANGHYLDYHFAPNNGGVDGEANNKHQIWIQTTLTWIV